MNKRDLVKEEVKETKRCRGINNSPTRWTKVLMYVLSVVYCGVHVMQ